MYTCHLSGNRKIVTLLRSVGRNFMVKTRRNGYEGTEETKKLILELHQRKQVDGKLSKAVKESDELHRQTDEQRR